MSQHRKGRATHIEYEKTVADRVLGHNKEVSCTLVLRIKLGTGRHPRALSHAFLLFVDDADTARRCRPRQ